MESKNATFQIGIFLLLTWFLATGKVSAQISAPGSVGSELTDYPVFPQNDPIFVFCTAPGEKTAALQMNTTLGGQKTYFWEKFNQETGTFSNFHSENTSGNQSLIQGLDDGGYRVTVTSGTEQQVFRAWVFNFWRTVEASVSESNCDYFTLSASYEQSLMAYYDISTGTRREIAVTPEFIWREGETIISRFDSPTINEPPTSDTDYTISVSDRFNCDALATVRYISIVTKAMFSADPMQGEAPLTVTFNNQSENGDNFEWYFFKDLDIIKQESQGSTQPIDSIMVRAIDFSPVFIYENSGTYMVKLVSHKISQFWTCSDTAYLESYIIADTSYIAAPNVFTPNGDGTNDNFVVKFWSMQEVKVSVFNRWGRTVHVFESKNVRGFDQSWTVSAWDGRIGGRDASEGVYYYVIEGLGRDGKKRWHKGFVHLFR